MKVVYLSHPEVTYIYEDLKENGYYEWYITLKIIDEMQVDYTFLSKLMWSDLLDNEVITNINEDKEKSYSISDTLKKEIKDVIYLMDVENYDEKIVNTTAKSLHTHLLETYDSIKKYNDIGIVFRIDFFKDYTIDLNGVKTYAKRENKAKEKGDDGITRSFLYVAVLADRHEERRPSECKSIFWDKKVGKSKFINKRMHDLSKDKRHGGTQSPIYVKALSMWLMSEDLCDKIETEIHFQLDERNTSGEWYEDYNGDILNIVEKKINSLKRKGEAIFKIPITKFNQDVTFSTKIDEEFWEKNKDKILKH